MRRYLLACALASIVAAPLAAQVTISTGTPAQYVGPLGKDSQLGPIPTVFAQTFKAPVGTSSLQSFSFYITNFFGGADLLLDASVYQFQTDHLAGAALFSSQLNGTGLLTDVQKMFGSTASPLNVALTQGVTYAFVLSAATRYALTPDGSSILAGATLNDTYANGALYLSSATTAGGLAAGGAFALADNAPDAAFSATFVSTSVVPEPATVALFAMGLALVGMATVRAAKNRRRGNIA